jgi:hypothetical protein
MTKRAAMPVEDLAWIGAIVAAIALGVAFILLVPELAKLYPEPKDDVFAVWRPLVMPEAREEVRSMLTLAAPIVLGAVLIGLGTREAGRRSIDPLILGVQVAGVTLIVVGVLDQPRQSGFLVDYFKPYLVSVPNLVAAVVLGIGMTVAVLRWSGRLPSWAVRIGESLRGRSWLALGIALLATVIFVLPAVVTDATVGQAGQLAAGHIPVQAEDYFSVVNGRTPLVDYIAQYANLLPLLLEPVLATFDSSITALSIAMCTLSTIALLAVFGVFRQVTRGSWTALALYLPFLALALFPWNDNGPFRNFDANYYGILPGRLFGPFLLAWLFAVSTQRRIPIWALFGFAGLVLVNNAEFGIPALLSLIVAMGVSWDRSTPLRERVRRLAVEGATGLIGAILLVCAVILIRTGELPDPTLLTYFNRVFLQDSFGLIPMPTLGLQWALYFTYAGALVMAAVRYVRDDPDRTLTTMLAFSGIFGLATGMYFVGRSSQFQLMLLFPAWALSLALVAWTAARSLRHSAGERERLKRILLPACTALVGFGLMVSAIARVSPPWRQIDRLADGGVAVNDQLAAQRYVEANTHPGEHVLIIGTTLDHRVADRAGVVNVSPVNGITGLIVPDEANRAIDQLEEAGGTEVFESVSDAPGSGGLVFKIPEFAAILRERGYRLVGEDPSIHMHLWRRES